MKETNPDPDDYEGEYNPLWEFYFYTINGQKLVTIDCNNANAQYQPNCWVVGENVYFKKKLLVSNGVYVVTDRLGTVRGNTQGEGFEYYPFGEERTNRPDGRDKFATYFRDGVGQDYAEQRYYNAGMGRFWSPDPGGIKTASASRPSSWNRYAYTEGDPVNYRDPTGTNREYPDFCDVYPDDPSCDPWYEPFSGWNSAGPDLLDPGTLPTLGGPYASKQTAATFARAVKREEDILSKNPDCAKLIGGSDNSTAGSVDTTIDNATWNVDLIPDSQSPGGVLPNTVAAATDSSTQTVTINVLGGFVTPTQTFQSLPGVSFDMLAPIEALVPGISVLDAQAFILLHETAHLTGALGPDRNDQAIADAFNTKIAQDCFHQ
jgi:RHS repeat-associated protein